jgi:UrcA family protein
MPQMNHPKLDRRSKTMLAGAACAALLAGAAAPALAQTTGELTVTGHWRVGENVRSLSAAVPYNDLDLNTVAGRDMLKQRVNATAHDLCDRLGEGNTSSGVAPSCEQDAMSSARDGIKVAIANSYMPNYAYLPDEPYVAPVGATAYGANASAVAPTVTTQTVTNGAVPDTPENRARYGGPMSHGGRMTTPSGN